ncbi:MAG: prolipoprotein diacylglyceryl transferase [bacterium]|nr:prolipoprotein diacylglyceryl transferase [bacterium]
MHRIIFNFGPFTVTSYGVMLLIAFVVGIWLAEKRAEKYRVPREIISNLSIVLIITGVIGARFAYVFENMDYYVKYPGEILKVWDGGLIFYGGFGLAVLCGLIFLKKRKVKIAPVLDIVAPSIALGFFFARIGCFLNGCCFGKPTNLPWGVVFPENSPVGWVFNTPVRIHPTQLYESFAGLCIFITLLTFEKKKLFVRRILWKGYLFWLFLVLYSGWRFFVDFLRYYESKAYLLWGLTHNQLASIFVLLLSASVILAKVLRKINDELSETHI